jgi:thiol-disulfide isomerase/thioredoxin
MKKIALIVAATMLLAVFAGCVPTAQTQETQQSTTDTKETEQASAQDPTQEPTQAKPQEFLYEFEFEDIDGNVHKLSDYAGKPVYLEIWGSWCGVCVAALEETVAWSKEPKDYYVLTVVFPDRSGEKSKEDFIAWYKEQGHEGMIVLLDTEGQILSDFGIRAFPSQIYFDVHGNFEGGQIGQLPRETIDAAMSEIAAQE